MAKVQSFRELVVWNRAMEFAEEVYRLCEGFPTTERWRLIDQVSRAAVSVPGNIAEGQGRSTSKDFAHFLAVAKGSLNEAETYLLLSIRLGYLTERRAEAALAMIVEVSKMLAALRASILGRAS
jgi:four helix bundle protein